LYFLAYSTHAKKNLLERQKIRTTNSRRWTNGVALFRLHGPRVLLGHRLLRPETHHIPQGHVLLQQGLYGQRHLSILPNIHDVYRTIGRIL
jgi:hypothetical protein